MIKQNMNKGKNGNIKMITFSDREKRLHQMIT